jgi:hypothetical protein
MDDIPIPYNLDNKPIMGSPNGFIVLRPVQLNIIEKMSNEKRNEDLKVLSQKHILG